jgi:tetratricopeptide (TPR) repeat protein
MGSWVTRSVVGTAIVLTCMVGHPADSHAQHHPPAKAAANPNKTRATELFKKSAEAYLRGDFAQTIALLDEAYALDPQPVLVYNKARAHEGLGHLAEAIELYEKYLAEEPASRDRGAIEKRLVALRQQRDERGAVEKERSVVEQERAEVEKERATQTSTTAPPPEPPRRRSVVPYVVMGVGAAGLASGTVFGLMALSREDDATAEPTQQKSVDLRDKGATFATVSNISFIAGGVLVAAGAVWWFVDGRSSRRSGSSTAPVQVGLGPGSIQLGGTFE